MGHKPSDIKPPSEINCGLVRGPYRHVYTGTFGRAESEIIAQRIVFESQGWGEWVSVSEGLLSAVLTESARLSPEEALNHSRDYLREMVEGGILNRDGKDYRLSEAAIEVLAARFPADVK